MTTEASLQELFLDHARERQRTTESALAALGFDALVIDSGSPLGYFADDTDAPYRPTPHFAHWLPLESPGSLLVVRPSHKPHVVQIVPQDFWHEHASAGGEFWESAFDRTVVGDVAQAWKTLATLLSSGTRRAACIGPDTARAGAHGLEPCTAENPDGARLLARLDWARATKSPYEIACLRQATVRAAAGHRAAFAAFEANGSELDVHLAFLSAVRTTESDLAYETIVGLDEKAAVQHYHVKRRARSGPGHVLLIDAGARAHGYCSDITRTYAVPAAHAVFRALLASVDEMQKELCALVRPGVAYLDLHLEAHAKLARILLAHDILRAESSEAAVALGHTRPFLPHGLGHLLGIQVHDVGGLQLTPDGGRHERPKEHPFLRAMRTLEPGHVYTIEPGCYFIDMLLSPLRTADTNRAFNWPLIDALSRCGGIRIEDNVVVGGGSATKGDKAPLNLTRAELP